MSGRKVLGSDPFAAMAGRHGLAAVAPSVNPPNAAPKQRRRKATGQGVGTELPLRRRSGKASGVVETAAVTVPETVAGHDATAPAASTPAASKPLFSDGGVDEFGRHESCQRRIMTLAGLLYRRWFRVECEGVENIPASGGAILVANHAGIMPWDSLMIMSAVGRAGGLDREIRPLLEDDIYYLPWVGAAMNKAGAVRACQENATRLIERGQLVLVFPEGTKGVEKPVGERYRLQRFGRGGYVKLALRTGVPLIPVSVVGSEEVHPILYNVDWLARLLRTPYFPVTATPPFLGPYGLLPLPSKWKIIISEPIRVDGRAPSEAENRLLVNDLSEQVRTAIQRGLDASLQERRNFLAG